MFKARLTISAATNRTSEDDHTMMMMTLSHKKERFVAYHHRYHYHYHYHPIELSLPSISFFYCNHVQSR
jgi:hypothetical protein